jgi:hypothetical protein
MTEEQLRIYELVAADPDMAAATVDQLCDAIFELSQEIRHLNGWPEH